LSVSSFSLSFASAPIFYSSVRRVDVVEIEHLLISWAVAEAPPLERGDRAIVTLAGLAGLRALDGVAPRGVAGGDRLRAGERGARADAAGEIRVIDRSN